jgi:hypothetical protein
MKKTTTPKPVFGNFGTLERQYGEPTARKPTADEQANRERIGGPRKNERRAFPTRKRS